jgi:hypothetical protein
MTNCSDLEKKHKKLLEFFSKSFFEVYNQMDKEVQSTLLEFAPNFFHRWYVSALIPETNLSPCVAFRIDFSKKFSKENVYAYKMTLDRTQKDMPKFQYKLLEYSLQQHPFIEDLKIILDYCEPDCEMTEDGNFLKKDENNLLQKISRSEIEYLHYLTQLLHTMEFLKPLPSIHTIRVQTDESAKWVLKKETKQILDYIIHFVINMACYEITEAIGAEQGCFHYDMFYSFLQNNMDTEDIFIKLYECIDIDISQIWEAPSLEDFSEEQSAIASSFFYMGILLDKWFLTPLGDFLQIIQPTYYLPFYFIPVFNRISNLIVAKCSLQTELYSPCSVYDLTPIGEIVLGKKGKKQPLPVHIDFYQIIDAIIQHSELNLFERTIQQQGINISTLVCPIKVTIVKHPDYWKIIEVLDTSSLYEICSEICSIFDLADVFTYSITAQNKNSFPLFQGSPLKHKNQEPSPFLPSSFSAGDVLYFTPDKDKNRQLKLEFLPKQKQIPFILYPRLRKQSSIMKVNPFDID